MWTSLLAFGLAFGLAVLTVPVAKRLALLLGIVDSPDKHRKLHGRVVPLTGGLLLLAVLPTSLAAAAWCTSSTIT